MTDELSTLNELNWGYRASKVLHVANSLDIFTILGGKAMTVEQIVSRTGSNPEMMEKLLIACVSLGLLAKHGDKYANCQLSKQYLVHGEPLYQGDIIRHSGKVWNFWSGLEEYVSTGNRKVSIEPDDHRSFILGMHNVAVAGRVQLFLDSVDLSGKSKMFDVGGGPGTYSLSACKRYRELSSTIFDLPETIAITKEFIEKDGLQDRVRARAGDWEEDDFGRGNDVVLLSNVMHGPTSKAESILCKAYDSMVDDGLLVIQEFLLNDEKTGPVIAALFNVMVGAYSREELFSVVEASGFCDVKLAAEDEKIGSSLVTARKK
ncbi:methyltransferase [Planctomycetota bacterium]